MKEALIVATLAIVALVVLVPKLGGVIRQIEPGRDRTIEIQNLSNSHIDIPTGGPYVLAHCADPCRLGSWIKLYVGRIPKSGFLAVWAESGADRVWYYPTDANFYPKVEATPDVQVLSDGLKLSSAQGVHKRWTLKLALLDSPYTRAEIETLMPDHVIASHEMQIELGEGKR